MTPQDAGSKIQEGKDYLPAYLKNNSWEEELNFKLWSTKGARFRADKRCQAKDRWLQYALTLLTSYLIIIGIMPLLPKSLNSLFPSEIMAFTTTAISILLLAYSLIEASRNYALRAHKFHECALKISALYDELRFLKENGNVQDKERGLRLITKEYQGVLSDFENHDPIDYDTFKTSKPEYFELSKWDSSVIWLRYYVINILFYHLIILLPPLLVVAYAKTHRALL